MKELWIGFIIGLPFVILKLILHFKYDIKKEKKTTFGILSPLAILLGVIYGFFNEK